ncbi:MAG: orotidine-5'-phosphate decarboxylase [bacterium]|nr:orotidine-5'-phosphate decarboxylase [bacterium]
MAFLNAGQRLWETQLAQGTGLCLGLDSHGPDAEHERLYAEFALDGGRERFQNLVLEARKQGFVAGDDPSRTSRTSTYLAGVSGYLTTVIEAAWENGIRVFKPNIAFFERFAPFGDFVLARLCRRIEQLAVGQKTRSFVILDAKRGDISSTQEPYYAAYLSSGNDTVIPGLPGQFGFDAMTVTTWMGEDVLTPALPYLQRGKGVVAVTRSSNPSGTTLQDLRVGANPDAALSDKQRPFAVSDGILEEMESALGYPPTAQEVMLFQTTAFCRKHGLVQEGVSPVFSVVGATRPMNRAFRILRPDGIALVPGFGAQGGAFDNIMALAIPDGPMRGHLGILSSSRAHLYPWRKEFGGSGDPKTLRSDVERAIVQFRADEKAAYARASIEFPFE